MNYNYGYARVSADDQNLATQLDTLERAGCDKIYQEKVSGSGRPRPQLENLLAILRPGDTVTVARFFRLGRNSAHLISLMKDFEDMGVNFRALDLGMDSTTPAGRLVMTVFAGLAQFQREEILEKTAHGIELAKARGVHMGRKKGADPKQLAKVDQAMKKGLTAAETAHVTGISLATVKRYRKSLKDNEGLAATS
jgi:DNA invertase Pin-like site-specific DNA recombinase